MRKILIVEDDLDYAFELEKAFADEYEVHKSVDGMTAISRIHDEKYECVILDVSILGAVDGIQVLRAVKGDDSLKHIVVVVVTNSGTERKEEFLTAGADAYKEKGELSLDQIKALVNQLVENTLQEKKITQ